MSSHKSQWQFVFKFSYDPYQYLLETCFFANLLFLPAIRLGLFSRNGTGGMAVKLMNLWAEAAWGEKEWGGGGRKSLKMP